MLTEPGPNGEDYRPSGGTKRVWTERKWTDKPMARGVQVSLSGPLVPIAVHLLVPGEHNDEQAKDQSARCDQTQPPPEVDHDLRLCRLSLFVERLLRYGCHLVLQVLTPGPDFVSSGPYQAYAPRGASADRAARTFSTYGSATTSAQILWPVLRRRCQHNRRWLATASSNRVS